MCRITLVHPISNSNEVPNGFSCNLLSDRINDFGERDVCIHGNLILNINALLVQTDIDRGSRKYFVRIL